MKNEGLISADSHVMELPTLWADQLPKKFRDAAPQYSDDTAFQAHAGGRDPRARLGEMEEDGVVAEILYPTFALDQFGLKDPLLQEACFRVYNDWLLDYCSHGEGRLHGIAAISTFDIDSAIAELQRCKLAGMRGVMIWQVPPPKLRLSSSHYDRFWAAAQESEMSVSLHILTGTPFPPGWERKRIDSIGDLLTFAVRDKLYHVGGAISDIIFSGALERFPNLRFVLVENEISWLPFHLSQFDKYAARNQYETPLKMPPSEYFKRQIFATFFNDPPSRMVFSSLGCDNFLWSNDFPHPNSTWPHSKDVVERDLGELSIEDRRKLVSGNTTQLYGLPDHLCSPSQ
jgi:predicted TIM-barrel fold metal-dependent hydrolase